MKNRRIAHFSCGAASATAAALGNPDLVVYAETGSEHPDNERFLRDCEARFGFTVTRVRSEKYASTWDVWMGERYMGGIYGAPCTRHLKARPLDKALGREGVRIFGYTLEERRRAAAIKELFPGAVFPLIERYMTKAACLAFIERAGISLPIPYSQGFEHSNCLPCTKATSPSYWAAIREHYPEQFARYAELEAEVGGKSLRLKGQLFPVTMLPDDARASSPITPECDLMCHMASAEIEWKQPARTY